MKITFLGTGAGEQYPGFWCRCENCQKARVAGGKNIRRNSAIYLDDRCLIDIPSESFIQAERFNLDLIQTELLLITHSHEDHYNPHLLYWRQINEKTVDATQGTGENIHSAKLKGLRFLQIFGNITSFERLKNYVDIDFSNYCMSYTIVEPYRPYQAAGYEFTPLIANHLDGSGHGLNYIISKNGKTFLYGVDTGWFLPRTQAILKEYRFDCIIMEGTFGFGEKSEYHMNFEKVKQAWRFFEENNLWKDEKRFYITHLSPHWTPPYDELNLIMKPHGIISAYDGLQIDF
jgi:phosphoribosyl 1,2-cyclic phosphate phosphodiesterase